ncbi:MAG: hypothetical protein ACFFBK_02895 [Promethearchaeota archaeon]
MERIILAHWNTQTGPEPLIQYPPEENFPPKPIFLKIWAKHELNKENSMIEFIPEDEDNSYISIIQLFEGEIYFMVLVYSQKGNSKDTIIESPDILALISKNLVELINTNKITRAISEAFNTIRNYSKLDEEENIKTFFQDRIKFTILQILRDGVISKSELTNVLRNEYGFSTVNIDLILISFLQENLVIKKNVPGSKEGYFLINDLSCIRIPPKNVPKDQMPENILKKYKDSLKEFYFEVYKISDFEDKNLIQTVLFDKDVFSLLKILREKYLSVNECLNILNNRGELFNELIDRNFIYEAKGYVYPYSDFRFIKFLPFYIIKNLIDRYNNQKISLNEYMTHLKLISERVEEPLSINYEII